MRVVRTGFGFAFWTAVGVFSAVMLWRVHPIGPLASLAAGIIGVAGCLGVLVAEQKRAAR